MGVVVWSLGVVVVVRRVIARTAVVSRGVGVVSSASMMVNITASADRFVARYR